MEERNKKIRFAEIPNVEFTEEEYQHMLKQHDIGEGDPAVLTVLSEENRIKLENFIMHKHQKNILEGESEE